MYSQAFIRQIAGKSNSVPISAPTVATNQIYGCLNYAVGICMDDSNQIYVADTNNHRIVVFNHVTGVHIRNISSHGTMLGYLNSPYGVCVDNFTGILYVADYDNHRVQLFDKETGY